MKKITRISASMLMALMMVLGIFSGVEAKAATKGTVKSVSISAPVKVKAGEVKSYTLYQLDGKKATVTIKAKANVTGKVSKAVYYKSSNTKIATVGKTTGKVTTTGKKTGTVTITAYAKAKAKAVAKVKITVKKFAPVFKNKIADTYTLEKTKSISAVVKGDGIKSVSYASDNTKVAKIEKNGKVTFVAGGTATISAKVVSKSGVAKTLKKKIKVQAIPTKDTIDYANVKFDYAKDIEKELAAHEAVPGAAGVPFKIVDEKNATGVVVVEGTADEDTDYYMNALVAGNKLTIKAAGKKTIKSVSSSVEGKTINVVDGVATFVPEKLVIVDGAVNAETITITMSDNKTYVVHMITDLLPNISINKQAVAADNKGIYTFCIDKVLLRVNTEGEIVYYRDLNCWGDDMIENFAPQMNGKFFSYFAELRSEFRNVNGGFSSGVYVVLDSNYVEKQIVSLAKNAEKNHVHGEGYLDQHEFVMISENHHLLLSYTPMYVSNLPYNVKGVKGSHAYVWAGIMQEVKNGKVVKEINTADYPLLYDSAVEKCNYEKSNNKGLETDKGQDKVFSKSEGWMDYVHVNSLDYTLKNGKVEKLLVSMRDQSAVYQFDMTTAKIDWILGGKASTLKGYDSYTSKRKGDNGNEFDALTFGQHYARYVSNASGKTVISIFDNQTGMGPFLRVLPIPTNTRVFKATIDVKAKKATISDVIDGSTLDEKGGYTKYHNASHCGSVDYFNKSSVLIGWGLHGVICNIGGFAPEGTISDMHFSDLRQGSIPVFTEYDQNASNITFELSVKRNPLFNRIHKEVEGLFSYRTYKSVK